MRTIDREIVSALILSKDGKLLMGRKDSTHGGVYSDCWHIPGGGLDTGEDLMHGLTREIAEETGIDISTGRVSLTDDSGYGESEKTLKESGERVLCKMHFNVYSVQLDRDAAQVPLAMNDDLVELRWFQMSELQELKLTPPSITLFRKLGWIHSNPSA